MIVDPGRSSDAWREHLEGLRRLARSLVTDPHAADDVVQEAVLVGLDPAHAPERGLGPWLRGVLRNKAREARRAAGRRAHHEADAPPRTSPLRPDDVAAGLEVQARLLEAVRALPDPYRTVIWRRYFEGRPPREIAALEGVPVETVRTRLKRGIERLRQDLDRRQPGGRAAWMAALVPFARAGSAAPLLASSVPGGLAVAASLKKTLPFVVLVLAAGATAGLLVPRLERSTRPNTPEERAALDARESAAPAPAPGARLEAGAPQAEGHGEPGARLMGDPKAPPPATKVEAHEGRFSFHYQQGYSFRRRAVVPPEEADLVSESFAGGISSVTLAAPGGGIGDLRRLRARLSEVTQPEALQAAILRVLDPGRFDQRRAHCDERSPHSDVCVMRTRRGEWVSLAIVARKNAPGGWTKWPVEIVYWLSPDAVFSDEKGEEVLGLEIDTAKLVLLELAAKREAERAAEEAERERLRRAGPVLEHLARLDRRAAALEADYASGGRPATHVAAVLTRGYATPMGDREAYVAATYAFDHRTRDDPEGKTRNDWDFVLNQWRGVPWLRVRTVTDDRSVIRDLGAVDLETAKGGDFPPEAGSEEGLEAIQGHTYLIHTLDSESDHWVLMRILELDPETSMVFAYEVLDDPGPLKEALTPPEALLRRPYACLQIRGGAGGGNPNRVFLDGTTNAYVDETRPTPLELDSPATINERHVAYAEGGLVPPGQVFLVQDLEILGRSDGDSNGHGELLLKVGGFTILHLQRGRGVEDRDRWTLYTIDRGIETLGSEDLPVRRTIRIAGGLPIRSGTEQETYLEIANSSFGDARLSGRFAAEAEAPADPIGALRSTGMLRSVEHWIRRVADGGLDAEGFGRAVGEEAAGYLETVLACGATGAWRARVAAALDAVRDRR